MKKGFTLIEFIISISIIAVLASATAAVYVNAKEMARDGQREADVDAIFDAEQFYRVEYSRFASTKSQLDSFFGSSPSPPPSDVDSHLKQYVLANDATHNNLIVLACGMGGGTSVTTGGYVRTSQSFGTISYDCSKSDVTAISATLFGSTPGTTDSVLVY